MSNSHACIVVLVISEAPPLSAASLRAPELSFEGGPGLQLLQQEAESARQEQRETMAMAALQAKGVEFMEVDRKGNPGGVRLGQSQVTDTDLMHLKPLIYLKTVDLGGLQITDAGVAEVLGP